jgi:hypothetical protein
VVTPLDGTKAKEGDVADSTAKALRQQRANLTESLPALSRQRDHTYRENCYALARNRAGVTHHGTQEIERLGENEVDADTELRNVERELRRLDAEITSASSCGGLEARFGRALRWLRGDD